MGLEMKGIEDRLNSTEHVFKVQFDRENGQDWLIIKTRFGEILIQSSKSIERVTVFKNTKGDGYNLGTMIIHPESE